MAKPQGTLSEVHSAEAGGVWAGGGGGGEAEGDGGGAGEEGEEEE